MLGSTTRGEVAPRSLADGDALGQVGALDVVREPVSALIDEFLAARTDELAQLDPALRDIGHEVAQLVRAGGKRLRPAFVYWGWRATGAEHNDEVLKPAAAVELLHTFALIHDDIMDRSDERHGRPAVHRSLESVHRASDWIGDPGWFGIGGAILAGDLAFVWADQLIDATQLEPAALDRARRVFTELRIEVMAGQYLDLRLAGLPQADERESLRVALLKSGRYTVTRPLQLGAGLNGAGAALNARLAEYGDAVGLAFQLRDDVLGLFGDPDVTGKGALEDLREGKRTVLMIRALQLASRHGREVLEAALGNAELDEPTADRARQVVVDCGALAFVEQLLAERQHCALDALGPLPLPARAALAELAELAAFRAI